MKRNLVLPTDGVATDYSISGARIYYLAGPREGGGGWQTKAVKLINKLDDKAIIVLPCKCSRCSKLTEFAIQPSFEKVGRDKNRTVIVTSMHFKSEAEWRRYYQVEASFHGAIIFWLPTETYSDKRSFEFPYAIEVYNEVAAWGVKSANSEAFSKGKEFLRGNGRVNLVIGAESEFPGIKHIKENLDLEHGRQFQIHESLKNTVAEAVSLAKRTNSFPSNL